MPSKEEWLLPCSLSMQPFDSCNVYTWVECTPDLSAGAASLVAPGSLPSESAKFWASQLLAASRCLARQVAHAGLESPPVEVPSVAALHKSVGRCSLDA
jgi:hypothetical protein